MGLAALSSRAVRGMYYAALEQNVGAGWLDGVSNYFPSDQAAETYEMLGQVAAMREWIGGRHLKELLEHNFTITNAHYETSIHIPLPWMRRDKTGQIRARINDLAARPQSHFASLLSTLLIAGETALCYDGQAFFDTDHTEGNNTTNQSNDISVDISGLPVTVAGSTTAPSVEEMQLSIYQTIQQILSFKDNENEPMNEGASDFLVMVPVPFMHSAMAAVYMGGDARQFASQTGADALAGLGVSIRVAVNPRLTWTTKFATFRTDGPVRALIRQEEMEPDLKVLAEGSDYEYENDGHSYGLDAWRSTGYGLWQMACLATLA